MFTNKIYTEITINSTKENVWEVLMRFDDYAKWNPFITDIKGSKVIGERLDVAIDGMKFTPVVLENKPNEVFSWLGSLWFKGIFDGNHIFELKESKDGVLFIHKENFRGVLVPFLKKMLNGKTRKGFIAMNKALKKVVEN